MCPPGPIRRSHFASLAVGLACCLIIAVGVPYGSFPIRGAWLGLSSSTPAAFFGLFVILLTLQPLLRRIRHGWSLRRGELITLFFMMMVASASVREALRGRRRSCARRPRPAATPDRRPKTGAHVSPAGPVSGCAGPPGGVPRIAPVARRGSRRPLPRPPRGRHLRRSPQGDQTGQQYHVGVESGDRIHRVHRSGGRNCYGEQLKFHGPTMISPPPRSDIDRQPVA